MVTLIPAWTEYVAHSAHCGETLRGNAIQLRMKSTNNVVGAQEEYVDEA